MKPEPITLEVLSDQPLISIITPCYNAERYIAETIECVIAQTYSNWEMVICDDGSTDESVKIIEALASKDSRIRLIKQVNAGAAAATNTAYDASKGEIIAFLDADDLFEAGKLNACVQAFQERPDSGFLTHRLKGIDHLGQENGIIFPGVPKLVNGWFARHLFDKSPTRGSAAPSAGNLVRREVVEKVMPIPMECQRTQDAYVLTCAMLLTPAIGLDLVLGAYRIHPGGQSRGQMYSHEFHERRMADLRKSVNAIRGFCQQQGFDEVADYLAKDYYHENVGYLENVVIYYLLTGKLTGSMQDENPADLFYRAGKKGRRFKLLLKWPVSIRRHVVHFYGWLGRMMSANKKLRRKDD